MRCRIVFCLVVCMLLIGCQSHNDLKGGTVLHEADCQSGCIDISVITFSDPVIEAETRRILDKPEGDITTQEVLTITSFGDDWDRGKFASVSGDITTLEDLRWFINLESLVLSGCNISSLNGIEDLTNLVVLDCSNNNISDYSELSGLTNLEELSIGDNGAQRTDISSLASLIKLRRFYAPWCGIYDISILSNMGDLEYLQLFHNNIEDISALSNLTKLEYLELGTNKITDILPLENLLCLTYINLRDNLIPEDMLEAYYEPKSSDYFTTVFHEKINADMPEFTFELFSYYDRLDSGSYSLEKLIITNSETGERIQEISIPELAFCGRTYVSCYDMETMGFVLEDVNFDGYQDIKLFDTFNGNYRIEWIYLVWNPDKNIFEKDTRLNKITLASFDQEKKLIYGMERGSAADHWYSTYKYIDGDIVLIELTSDTAVRFVEGLEEGQILSIIPAIKDYPSWCLQHKLTKVLNYSTMEMDVVEEKYLLYIPNEWTLIAEYDSDSQIGKAIAEIVDWKDTDAMLN